MYCAKKGRSTIWNEKTKKVLYAAVAATPTLLSQDSELLDIQVESCGDEQEIREATPRGVYLKVNTLEGP